MESWEWALILLNLMSRSHFLTFYFCNNLINRFDKPLQVVHFAQRISQYSGRGQRLGGQNAALLEEREQEYACCSYPVTLVKRFVC